KQLWLPYFPTAHSCHALCPGAFQAAAWGHLRRFRSEVSLQALAPPMDFATPKLLPVPASAPPHRSQVAANLARNHHLRCSRDDHHRTTSQSHDKIQVQLSRNSEFARFGNPANPEKRREVH